MNETVFVIGGCRSGKSRHAQELAEALPGNRKLFLATCVPQDAEMRDRVRKHQEDRGDCWSALEVPVAVADAVREQSPEFDVILLDCLTLWMSNLLMETRDEQAIQFKIQALTDVLNRAACPVILVSNEVGAGIVPENGLARQYRDLVGFANQRVAACADRVIWTVAGIPVSIKSP
ncbi:MAG: bifunctional adenosylcobinamide kinase/adenosylcobinamide-phosphate guanylyltransferase [Thermodesulfobacteriota bacterium]